METLAKKKSHAFGKDVYLIGTIEGKYQWLEAPAFNCGWYWGFGYVEEYTSHKQPNTSRDIVSHQHMSSLLINGHDFSKFDGIVLNDKEKWQFAELFKQFYLLREMADFSHKEKPSCGITGSLVDHGNLKSWNEEINTVMIPKITSKILELLGEL